MDREKVRKGLEWILDGDRFGFGENWHIDSEPKTEEEQAGYNIQMAIALLKEQEAVEPVTESSVYDPDTWFFVCGSCKKGVIDRGDKFCRWCGQKVKWNEP